MPQQMASPDLRPTSRRLKPRPQQDIDLQSAQRRTQTATPRTMHGSPPPHFARSRLARLYNGAPHHEGHQNAPQGPATLGTVEGVPPARFYGIGPRGERDQDATQECATLGTIAEASPDKVLLWLGENHVPCCSTSTLSRFKHTTANS